MPPAGLIATIITESLALALVFLGLGGTAGALWHAAIGTPMLAPINRGPTATRETIEPPIALANTTARANTAAASEDGGGRVREFQNLPSHVLLRVPFSPQAPFGNWSQPYQDACEEASVAMAMAWVRGESTLPPERADEEILGQVGFEHYRFGYHRDTSLAQTLKLITRYYGYPNARIASDIAPEDIKAELAAGNLVIVPASGIILDNPFYADPPDYHMVVVVGYDDEAREFIVHDPGTRRGANYRYSADRLWKAIHDWTGSPETVLEGRKGMIVVSPAGEGV